MASVKKLNRSRIWKLTIAACVWGFVACMPLFFRDPFVFHVFNLIFLAGSSALGWAILARTGYIIFATNAFLGIGAYTSAYFVMQLGVNHWVGFLAAGAMNVVFALTFGVIVLRLKGIFFALASFCFAQIAIRVFRLAEPITGGPNGIRDIPPPTLPFIGPLESHQEFYVILLIYATLVTVFTVRLFNSNTGREFQAIGEDMFVAESMGIDTFRQKVIAFCVSTAIIGFTGSFYAHYFSFISDTTFEMNKAVDAVVYNVVGGMGSIIGPIIGASVMIPLPELLRGFVYHQIALYGLILILILRFFPTGIWGTAKRLIRHLQHAPAPVQLKPLRLSSELTDGFSMPVEHPISDENKTLLQCQGITKSFGGLVALDNVSFSINKGELLGIVGPNGAGKTTLYNVITGVLSLDQGTILFDRENITGLKPNKISRLGIARVFQARVLYSGTSVKDNIDRVVAVKAGFSGFKDFLGFEKRKHQWVSEQAQHMLKLCGLQSVADELPPNLPHGFQRVLGLAVALAAKPRLLLLDEPVTGMSIEEMNVIAEILEKLHQGGLAMIIVEHNVNFIMRLCPRIAVLDYGRKIAEGSPREIRSNPKVIEAFLGA